MENTSITVLHLPWSTSTIILPGGKGITGVDLVDRPNDALQNLPTWG